MGWRHVELTALGPEVAALSGADALAAARLAWHCTSKTRYGLDETAFPGIDRLDVNDLEAEAGRWLGERIGGGELLVVFANDEVFRLPAGLFLDRWRDMFCPSRDDVAILPVGGGWVLLYCHEDEFEFARGGPAKPLYGLGCQEQKISLQKLEEGS